MGQGSDSETRQRRVGNILANRRFQFKYGLYFFSSSLVAGIVFSYFTYSNLSQVVEQLLLGADPTTKEAAQALLQQLLLIVSAGVVLLAVFSFIIAVIFTHSIAGSMYAVRLQIQAMKEGRYEFRRPLRKNDELVPIMEDLHELCAHLQNPSRR